MEHRTQLLIDSHGRILRGNVPVYQPLSDRGACAWIGGAERVGGGISNRIEALDGAAVLPQHTGSVVGT